MKTLVITGGSKGIGLATARLFAAEGYRVVNISRSPIALAGAVQLGIDIAEPDWAARHGEAVRAAVAGSETIAEPAPIKGSSNWSSCTQATTLT